MSLDELEAFQSEHNKLRYLVADLKFDLAMRRLRRKYSPDQPRWPAGSGRISGRWSGGTGANEARLVDMQVAQGSRSFLFQQLLDQGGRNLGTFGNGVSIAVSDDVEPQESFDPHTGHTVISFTGRGWVVVDRKVGGEITGSLYSVGNPANRNEGLSITIDADGNVSASSTSGS